MFKSFTLACVAAVASSVSVTTLSPSDIYAQLSPVKEKKLDHKEEGVQEAKDPIKFAQHVDLDQHVEQLAQKPQEVIDAAKANFKKIEADKVDMMKLMDMELSQKTDDLEELAQKKRYSKNKRRG